jgi:hypothetical protein
MNLRIEKTTYTQDPEWLASDKKVHRPGGVTIDSTKVAAVDGKKILKAGSPIGKGSSGKFEPYTAAVAASKSLGVVADKNAIKFTANGAGAAGNAIKVQLLDPSGNDKALGVSISGDTIVVSLATGPAGAITSTAAEVIAAVNKDLVVKQLVTAANSGTSDGTGVCAAVEATALAGGTAATVVPTDLLFNTVDVTDGDEIAGSLLVGVVLEARLPVALDAVCKATLKGITLV